MYRLGKHQKSKRRRLIFWLAVLAFLVLLVVIAIHVVGAWLRPNTVITKSKPRVSKLVIENKTTHYQETDFSVDLPVAWKQVERPSNVYQIYAWQTSQSGGKGQEVDIYEDTIPPNFAVNRVLIIEGQDDRLRQSGAASDNCSTFTRGLTPAPGQVGVPAKWQNIGFLCDQFNQARDVIGTSSSDGVNTVLLKSPSTGVVHKFFFSYTNQVVDPDYTAFYDALRSFRVQ